MAGLEPDKVLPTVGLNIGRFTAAQSPVICWDLGGQAGLRSIWDKYYADSHAVMFVVDATDEARLDEAKHALDTALASRCGGWRRCWHVADCWLLEEEDLSESSRAED